MGKPTDIRALGTTLYFLPVQTRVPLKFGPETLTQVTCARVRVEVVDAKGRRAEGWGETPLSVQWVWPSAAGYEDRHQALKDFCIELTKAWAAHRASGHPMEVGYDFLEMRLPGLLKEFNGTRSGREEMPWLAALVCCSPFDLALHDAYGNLHQRDIYETYTTEFMNRDLSSFLRPTAKSTVSFEGKYPCDFLSGRPPANLVAWHLVGGLDLLEQAELTGKEPEDGFPVLLTDWIRRDGLKCLKAKLRGNDEEWDFERLIKVGLIGIANGVEWLSADFNCTVKEPDYVNAILDRLKAEHSRIYEMILYIEQPFPYDLEKYALDVRSVSARKPLFLDESAHDWRLVEIGRNLGWTGVALKTCKTQTGALLSGCWAKAHGMTLMVQDLSNPMLAQIPHVLLAAHTGTIMGVETNAMQFYPDASRPEAAVHPGLYRRQRGHVDLGTLQGTGFSYRLNEIKRELPKPAAEFVG